MLLTVAAATLAIALFGIPLAVGVFGYFLQDEQSELERAAAALALEVAVSDDSGGVPAFDPAAVEGGLAAVYSANGVLLAGTGPPTLPEQDRRSGNVGEEVVVVQPIVRSGTPVAFVRVATSHRTVYWRIVLVWLGMVALAVIAIGIAALLARWMAARLARPMEELSAAAGQLGAGDFAVRTARSGIREIDALAETLDQAAADISSTVAHEREFAAQASHQLRTPVAGLRLELEAALEDPDADLRSAISGAVGTADRLEEIITDLLELTGRRPGRGPDVDLPALVEETRRTWHGPLAVQGRVLRVVIDPAPSPAASAAAVRQILAVLVENAIHHGAGTVTITVRDAAGACAVDVADAGSGIVGDDDPFGPAESAGHGIGLPMARRLAEAEGGRLILSRAVPPVFTLVLRLAPLGRPDDRWETQTPS